MSIEEWWGRTFEGRGQVRADHRPDSKPATMRKMNTEDLLKLVRSEDTRSVAGLAAHMELRRRENWTARAAILISIVALVVAALKL